MGNENISLGQRLKLAQKKFAEAKRAGIPIHDEVALEKYLYESAHVTTFLDSCKAVIENIILKDRVPAPIIIDEKLQPEIFQILNAGSVEHQFDTAPHRFHQQWENFRIWAAENEISVKWHYSYSSGGERSWHEIVVSA